MKGSMKVLFLETNVAFFETLFSQTVKSHQEICTKFLLNFLHLSSGGEHFNSKVVSTELYMRFYLITKTRLWKKQSPVKHLRWSFFIKAINYFCKTLHLRCLAGFWISLEKEKHKFWTWIRNKVNFINFMCKLCRNTGHISNMHVCNQRFFSWKQNCLISSNQKQLWQ